MALYNTGADKRFYGIYRGSVVDGNDPSGKGRVKLKVPQVLGNSVTSWAWPVAGTVTQGKTPHGSFYDVTDQPLVSTTVAQVVKLGSVGAASGVTVVDGSKVLFENAGTYSLTFSIQITNLTNSVEKAVFWIRTDDVDYPDSATEIDMPARKAADIPNRQVLTVNYVATAAAGQQVEVWWSGSSTGLMVESLPAGTAPVYPRVPSIILTVVIVGNYVPSAGYGVWVMFEGGDPNFPLWLGAY